jgi:hypothetical protein
MKFQIFFRGRLRGNGICISNINKRESREQARFLRIIVFLTWTSAILANRSILTSISNINKRDSREQAWFSRIIVFFTWTSAIFTNNSISNVNRCDTHKFILGTHIWFVKAWYDFFLTTIHPIVNKGTEYYGKIT